MKKFEEENKKLSENKEKFYTFNLDYILLNQMDDAYCINIRFFLLDLETKLVCTRAEQIADILYGIL